MKRIIPFFIVLLVLSSCSSTTKQLQKGNYDKVIQKTTKKLIKKPNAKDAEAMDRAYRLANERDLERVTYLEKEDNPDYYDELFQRYEVLKNRQSKVRTVTPLTVDGKTYNYEYVDYDAKIVDSKRKAAEEYYRSGKALMENATSKLDYRDAFYQFQKADEYGGHNFSDLDQLIHQASMMGISRVIVVPMNLDPVIGVTEMDLDYLVSFDTRGLDKNDWVEYHFEHMQGDANYDYEIYVRILSIQISDDTEKETKEDFTTKSNTEFDYALDANGNVMKDTAGNDIKIYKDVSGTLIKKERSKNAVIRGEVETVGLTGTPSGSLMKVPFSAEANFNNSSYQVIGNKEAIPADKLALTKQEAQPFPSEAQMVKMCIEKARPVVRGIILDSSKRNIK